MKRMILAVVLTMTAGSAVFAADTHKYSVSLLAGGAFSKNAEPHGTGYYGTRLTCDITNNVGIGMEAGWLSFQDKDGSIKYGDIDGVPVMADVLLKMPVTLASVKIEPYLVGAAGAAWWRYRATGTMGANGLYSFKESVEPAFKVGGGVAFDLTERVSLFVEGAYFMSKYNVKFTQSGTETTGKLDMNMAQALVGVKYSF